MEKRIRKNKPQRNVEMVTFIAWKEAKRRGDPEKMARELGYSRPVIDKALIYGNVGKPELAQAITKFFEDRIAKENQTAKELLKATKTQGQISKKLS